MRYGAILYTGEQYFCHVCEKPYEIKGKLTGPKCGCLMGKPETKKQGKKKDADHNNNQPIGNADDTPDGKSI